MKSPISAWLSVPPFHSVVALNVNVETDGWGMVLWAARLYVEGQADVTLDSAIVADNGSADGSARIAQAAGARVLTDPVLLDRVTMLRRTVTPLPAELTIKRFVVTYRVVLPALIYCEGQSYTDAGPIAANPTWHSEICPA